MPPSRTRCPARCLVAAQQQQTSQVSPPISIHGILDWGGKLLAGCPQLGTPVFAHLQPYSDALQGGFPHRFLLVASCTLKTNSLLSNDAVRPYRSHPVSPPAGAKSNPDPASDHWVPLPHTCPDFWVAVPLKVPLVLLQLDPWGHDHLPNNITPNGNRAGHLPAFTSWLRAVRPMRIELLARL